MDTPPIVPQNPAPSPAPEDSQLRQWKVILHLSSFAGMVIPLGNVLAPLILWLVKKPEMPALEQTGKDVLNYQISWSIWIIIAAVIGIGASCLIVPLVLPFGFGIAWIILTVIGAVKASNGEIYTFPLTLKFIQ